MLIELNIRDFAIIETATICFLEGLNILTGETGTGKSIIVDSLNLVLGGRADKNYIKDGSNKTIVEALFYIDELSKIKDILDEYGIDLEEDRTILITRELYKSGRSVARINGRTVTMSMLSRFTGKLIDIQGQHEHQSLLSYENHIEFVDLLGSDNLKEYRKQVKKEYTDLSELKSQLNNLSKNEMERERTIDLLKFQIEEIEDMDLRVDEEEDLIKNYKILSNSQELTKSLNEVNDKLSSNNYNNKSVIDEIRSMYITLSKVIGYDDSLTIYQETLESISYSLEDVSRDISNYTNNIDFDYERLTEIDTRLSNLNKLKRKYGNSIVEILDYKEKILNDLNTLVNLEEELDAINTKIKDKEETLTQNCDKLSKERKDISFKLEKEIMSELKDLNMQNTLFKVNIEELDHFTEKGKDRLEFFISTNAGQGLKQMSKIASGGEMSRIMLAFKNILAEVDNISSLIFDEIDTGISGRTAQIVGEKILQISKRHQVICITHLPQIAAMADTHFLINKDVVGEKGTLTNIKKLEESERVNEICRLIGGVSVTNITRKHAEEMIELSRKQKGILKQTHFMKQ